MSNNSVQIPGVNEPIWLKIVQIITLTVLLLALLFALMYWLKLVLTIVVPAAAIILVKSFQQIFNTIKTGQSKNK